MHVYGRNICQLGGSWQTVGWNPLCLCALHPDIQRYTIPTLCTYGRDISVCPYVCTFLFLFLFFCHFPPFLFSYVNGASADAVLFILCPTQSYNLTVILLQHLIKINKCMSRREKGVGPRSSRTPGLLFLSVLFF